LRRLKARLSTIINESGGNRDRYRVRIPVGVAYGSDLDKVFKRENIVIPFPQRDVWIKQGPSLE